MRHRNSLFEQFNLKPNWGRPRIAVFCHETQKVYLSINEAADRLGVAEAGISACVRGIIRKHKGYTFRKATEHEIAVTRGEAK
jgi:hypothetical protein